MQTVVLNKKNGKRLRSALPVKYGGKLSSKEEQNMNETLMRTSFAG